MKCISRETDPRRRHASQAELQTIEMRRIDTLRFDGRNPRMHSPRQIKQLARSIATFGFTVPVLIDADGRVIAGHGRCLAAESLGWTDVGADLKLSHRADARLSQPLRPNHQH